MSTHDRKGRYVKPATRLATPGVAFALYVYPRYESRGESARVYEQSWGYAECAVSYRHRDKWTAAEVAVLDTPDQLRAWMEAHKRARYTNWVLCPDAADALTLSEWWSYAERTGIVFEQERRSGSSAQSSTVRGTGVTVSQIVMSDRCGILTYRERGTRWRYVSAGNYWPDGCAVPEDATGDSGRPDCATAERAGRGSDHAAHGAVPLLARFLGLCEWWGRVATAPLGCTAGQLAWGVLRSHIGKGALSTHECESTHRLERAASFGGRASVWYAGPISAAHGGARAHTVGASDRRSATVRGPVHSVDVSSMYPALLRDMPYPVKAQCLFGEMPVAHLLDMCRSGGVIAKVRVTTERGEYPLRRDDDTIYPTGEFVTTLAAPELLELQAHGAILKVHEVATYVMGRPFASAMDTLLTARADAKRRGDDDGEQFAKLVANSLAGKLAQRDGAWVRREKEDCPGAWGEWHRLSMRSGKLERYRHLAGAAWEWVESKLPRGPHTSAFAYLTAYGRVMMRRIRDLCPPRTVVQMDTDGMHVLDGALEALAWHLHDAGSGPGTLRLDKTRPTAQFWGPRHYKFGEQWVMSGYRSFTFDETTARIWHQTRAPLFNARATGAPDTVQILLQNSAFPVPEDAQRTGPDGWRIAPHLHKGRLSIKGE